MTIIKRLILTLTIALAALIFIGAFGLSSLKHSQERFEYMAWQALDSFSTLKHTKGAVSTMRTSLLKLFLTKDEAKKQELERVIANDRIEVRKGLDDYQKTLYDDTDRKMFEADKAALEAYFEQVDSALAKLHQNDLEGAIAVGLGGNGTALGKALDDHFDYNIQIGKQLNQTNNAEFQRTIWIFAGVILLATLLTVVQSIALFRVIRNGLNSIRHTLQDVKSSLDFTRRAPVLRQDEIGQTAQAFNELLAHLQDSLKSIFHSANEVAAASTQLTQAASQVSSAATTQSQASANVAATVEQMTVSVNQVAHRANEAHTLAREAGELAQTGSETIVQSISDIREIASSVQTASENIRELEGHTAQVSSVVQVIKDVADQTNLLALNAAIEAARAGETGRGFAVVADEVRKLAERTTASTQEIANTIQAMSKSSLRATEFMQAAEQLVANGVERADGADQAIRQIGESTNNSVSMVSEITSAIHEQGAASTNIATQIERIAQMSEESSAAAEQTAASANLLDELAKAQITTLRQYVL
jgi:methyl-accepting chemotaxis protein